MHFPSVYNCSYKPVNCIKPSMAPIYFVGKFCSQQNLTVEHEQLHSLILGISPWAINEVPLGLSIDTVKD